MLILPGAVSTGPLVVPFVLSLLPLDEEEEEVWSFGEECSEFLASFS